MTSCFTPYFWQLSGNNCICNFMFSHVMNCLQGNMDWCAEYRLHGPECRKCRQRGNCSFPCTNEPKYQCKLCGLWSHHESQCPDRVDFEYRKNWGVKCIFCSNTVSFSVKKSGQVLCTSNFLSKDRGRLGY